MDPNACLNAAETSIADGDLDEALSRLEDYTAWRQKGGFQPPDGDRRAVRLRSRIRAIVRELATA